MLETDGHCEDDASLSTSSISDAQTYGVMFTVKSKDESLLFQTLEIRSAKTKGYARVKVFTKRGSYQGFQNNPEAWNILSDTRVKQPEHDEGSILIPAHEFRPVEIDANEEISFYVTLDSLDLRYSLSNEKAVGSVYAEDQNLQILVGGGLLKYPFSDELTEPRSFVGRVYYRKIVDCDKGLFNSSSTFPFSFVTQHEFKDMDRTELIEKIDPILQNSISNLISTDSELKSMSKEDLLIITGFHTIVSPVHTSEAYTECVSNERHSQNCLELTSEITFTHNSKLKENNLIYKLLKHRAQIVQNMNLDKSMDFTYAGVKPVEAHLMLNFDKVPNQESLSNKRLSYIQKILEEFLRQRLTKFPSFKLMGVEIAAKNPDPIDKNEIGVSPIDINLTVLATVDPPPFIDVTRIVEEAITTDATALRDNLVNHRDISLTDTESKYFSNLEHVTVKPEDGVSKSDFSDGGGRVFLLEYLIVLFAIIGLTGYWFRVKRKNKKSERLPFLPKDKGDEEDLEFHDEPIGVGKKYGKSLKSSDDKELVRLALDSQKGELHRRNTNTVTKKPDAKRVAFATGPSKALSALSLTKNKNKSNATSTESNYDDIFNSLSASTSTKVVPSTDSSKESQKTSSKISVDDLSVDIASAINRLNASESKNEESSSVHSSDSKDADSVATPVRSNKT